MSVVEIVRTGRFSEHLLRSRTMHAIYLDTTITVSVANILASQSSRTLVMSIGEDDDSRVVHGVGRRAVMINVVRALEDYDDRCKGMGEDGQSAPLITNEAELVHAIAQGLRRSGTVYVAVCV